MLAFVIAGSPSAPGACLFHLLVISAWLIAGATVAMIGSLRNDRGRPASLGIRLPRLQGTAHADLGDSGV